MLAVFALGFFLGVVAGFGLSELIKLVGELFGENDRNSEKVRIPA